MHPSPTHPSPAPCIAPGALIQVEHLSRVIGSRARQTLIVDDVTFSVPAQSLFAINGPSGSGKSTILNMLTGIDRPTSGRVLFAGRSCARWGRMPWPAGEASTSASSSSSFS